MWRRDNSSRMNMTHDYGTAESARKSNAVSHSRAASCNPAAHVRDEHEHSQEKNETYHAHAISTEERPYLRVWLLVTARRILKTGQIHQCSFGAAWC